jgi:hypothetical protein
MKSLKYGFFKQISPFSAAAVALFGLVGIASPARADTSVLCPNLANQNGEGTYTFTAVPGSLDASCGVNSAVKIDIPTEVDYARLMWDSTVTNYPAGLTLGNLVGLSASVPAFSGQPGDQPYYMLAFTDPSDSLGQTAGGGLATDQILMLEFQTTTLSGTNMAFDPNATKVNLYDNTNGFYLAAGQADTETLAGWIATYPSLGAESLQQVRIGIGLAGSGTNPESITVNSLAITTPSSVPEPRGTSLLLVTALLGVGLVVRRRTISDSTAPRRTS